jgi:hypothetical protein
MLNCSGIVVLKRVTSVGTGNRPSIFECATNRFDRESVSINVIVTLFGATKTSLNGKYFIFGEALLFTNYFKSCKSCYISRILKKRIRALLLEVLRLMIESNTPISFIGMLGEFTD